MPDEPSVAGRHETASAPAPRFTSLEGGYDCAGCAALREQNRLLAESQLLLIDRNVALAAKVRAFEESQRQSADLLLGLAGLQKAAGA